ncbi:MAG: hypothetical protein J6S54_03340 [Lentisphaeria bacterium]|nr:hypothetical protein [Lentisphaeria bacterium]
MSGEIVCLHILPDAFGMSGRALGRARDSGVGCVWLFSAYSGMLNQGNEKYCLEQLPFLFFHCFSERLVRQ